MHEMTDQTKPNSTKSILTIDGVELGSKATMNPKRAKGIMQYPITLIDWKSDLNSFYCYPLLPRSLEFKLTRNDPIQKMRKTLTKLSYTYPA